MGWGGGKLIAQAVSEILPGKETSVSLYLSTENVYAWGSCSLDLSDSKKADGDAILKNVTPESKVVRVQTNSIRSNTVH